MLHGPVHQDLFPKPRSHNRHSPEAHQKDVVRYYAWCKLSVGWVLDSLTMSKPVPGAMGGAKWGLLGLNALDIDPSSATHRKTARASPTYKKTEFYGKLGIAGEELQGSLPRPWQFPPVSIKVN